MSTNTNSWEKANTHNINKNSQSQQIAIQLIMVRMRMRSTTKAIQQNRAKTNQYKNKAKPTAKHKW